MVCRADGYCCLADIVVATPGRLVDHIDQTPGFSLQQLRFLVGHLLDIWDSGWGDLSRESSISLCSCLLQIIDEADRMIDSMHQSWLPRVVAAAFYDESPTGSCALLQRTQLQAVTAARYPAFMRAAYSPLAGPIIRSQGGIRKPVLLICPLFSSTCCPQMPLQKLLFSATLTQNPEKLQRLGLYQPRLFSTRLGHRGSKDTVEVDGNLEGKYTFPVGLTVSM